MVRLAILLVLLCLTVWEWRGGVRKTACWLAMVGLFIFFSLRYGQGTDYLTYLSIYANVPPIYQLPNYFAFQYNKIEIGYFYLQSVFRALGAHYVVFIAAVTLLSLLSLRRFTSRFCPAHPMFALTVFYAVYSLTYMESGIRQLLAISVALGWVLIDWSNARRIRAIAGIVVATLLHNSAVLLFVLPVLFWNPRGLFAIEWRPRTTVAIGGLLLGAAAVINFVDLTPLIEMLPARLEYTIMAYYGDGERVSLLALGNRSLFMLIIFVLSYRARAQLSGRDKLLFNLYCVGFVIYVIFMSYDLIASRTNVYFRIVEIALLPVLMGKNRDLVKRTFVAMPVLLMLLSFLYVKDVAAIMDFAGYYSKNPLEYPYITVLNMDSLLNAKYVNVKNANAMNAYRVGGSSYDEYYETMQRKPSVRSPILPY